MPEKAAKDVQTVRGGIRPEILARLNPIKETYTTSKGVELKIRTISGILVERIQDNIQQSIPEPEPPLLIIDHGKGRTSETRDVKDHGYLLAHAKWQGAVSREILLVLFDVGIECTIPENLEDDPLYRVAKEYEQKEITPRVEKFLYLNTVMDSEEAQFLSEAIVGKGALTKSGLDEAAEEFPSQS